MRAMLISIGSDHNAQVDPVWMATALRMIGPDGLTYWPSFPWAKKPDWSEPSVDGDHYAVPLFVGRTISAMTLSSARSSQSGAACAP